MGFRASPCRVRVRARGVGIVAGLLTREFHVLHSKSKFVCAAVSTLDYFHATCS